MKFHYLYYPALFNLIEIQPDDGKKFVNSQIYFIEKVFFFEGNCMLNTDFEGDQ